MGYRFKAREAVITGLQRIARQQVEKALAELADPNADPHLAVHEVRKRCKMIRGALRLVRPAFEADFAVENAWYRDAARALGGVRDAQSLLESYQKLAAVSGARMSELLGAQAAGAVVPWLSARRDRAAAGAAGLEPAVAHFAERLREGRRRIASWSLSETGFEALRRGLRKTYARGRRAMADAYRTPSGENFHEWRKRVKYHWYHMRLLQKLHPEMIDSQRRQADRLGQLLGEEHDLALLRDLLDADEGWPLDGSARQALGMLIDRRRAQLRRDARHPGLLLYCEKPNRLTARLGCYWRHWQHQGAE